MLKEIWITRHGFREDWVNPIPIYPTGLKYDPPLSSFGLEQAKELGDFLKEKSIQRIYTSPFYRVLQTIQPLTDYTQIPVYIDHSMSEWYGQAYETYQVPASKTTLQELFPTINFQTNYQSSVELPIGGETILECHERTKKGLISLIQQLDKEDPTVETILLSGHAATVITSIRALMNDPTLFVGTGTCSLAKLKRRCINDQQQWDLIFHGNCDHLSKGEQRSWMFKDDVPDYEKNKLAN
ncbi:unnamed protein product [Cunninghamella blakesleeana]